MGILLLNKMVYEAAIPKVPTREEELKMISKIEENFASQPVWRWMPADAERISNIAIQEKREQYYSNWRANFLMGFGLGMLVFTPICQRYMSKRLSGIPVMYRPKMQ